MSHFVQFNTKQNRSSFIVLRVKWLIAVFHETNLTKYQKRKKKWPILNLYCPFLPSLPSLRSVSEVTESNRGPLAVVGPDRKLFLPVSGLSLDGSGSSDDRGIVSYHWDAVRYKQLLKIVFNQISSAHHSSDSPVWSPTCFCSGPPGLKLEGVDQAVATATGLRVGRYTFRLTVCDQEGATDSAALTVQVQEGEAASLHELFCTSTKHSVLFSDILWTKQLINN